MLHPQTMKQRDQPRTALIDDGELLLNPRPDMARRARQGLGNPGFQPLPLLDAQMTGAALVAEPGQPLDPFFPVKPEPSPNRIVVEKKNRRDIRATHSPIQEHKGVGASRQTMLDQAIPSQRDQLSPFRRVQKSRATHAPNKNPFQKIQHALIRVLIESGYTIVFSKYPFNVPAEVESRADIFRIRRFDGKYAVDCSAPDYFLDIEFFPIGCSFGTFFGGSVTGVFDAQIFTLSGRLVLPEGFNSSPYGPYQLTRAAPLPNNPPTGVGEAYTFVGSHRRTVDADHGVLANDTDAEDDALTAVLDTAPAQGELTLRADGSFDYEPNHHFVGTDEFFYLADDGFSESAPVAVTITVESVKAMPWLGLLLLDD